MKKICEVQMRFGQYEVMECQRVKGHPGRHRHDGRFKYMMFSKNRPRPKVTVTWEQDKTRKQK